MKMNPPNRNRTLLFLALAMVTSGAANAGALQVTRVGQVPGATAGGVAIQTIANHSGAALQDARVFIDGRSAANCDATTAQGHPFHAAGRLRDGDSVRCSGPASSIHASVNVLARSENGAPFASTAHQTAVTADLSQQAEIGLLMGAVFNDGSSGTPGAFDAGETIDYTFTVLNPGNVELDYITLTDDLGLTITCPTDTLAAGASMVCSGTYTIPANAPPVIAETGYVDGTVPDVTTAHASDSVIRTAVSGSEIRALKSPLLSADRDHDGQASAGDLLAYTFAIKNSGNSVLDPITLTEPDPSRIDGPIICAATTLGDAPFAGLGLPVGSGGALPVGDTVLCTATYTIQPDDVTAGVVHNQVNVSGQPSFGGIASGSAASTFTLPPPAAVTPTVPVPANDWRALLLLGLGLLAAGIACGRRPWRHSGSASRR